jgi:tetratricopeptide (TPR) repeat protein
MRRCALLLVLACACTGDRAAPHLARGNVLVNNGKREEAAAEYREAARLAPKAALPLERLGDTLHDLGRRDEALVAYREASAREPASVTARIGAARVLLEQGRLPEARDELTLSLRDQPTNLYALLSRGNVSLREGNLKAALEDFQTAVHLKSDNVAALYQYGLALLADGQREEAERTFDRLVQVAPESPEGYHGRARTAAARGDAPAAAQALHEASLRVAKDARTQLAEQGLRGEDLDRAAADATRRSLAQIRAETAFAAFASDAAFRRTAGWE